MKGRITDHKNRNLAKLHEDVAFGRANGEIIWQPRIQCWLTDKQFAGEKLPDLYEGKTKPEIYRELGCSSRIYEYNDSFYSIDGPKIKRYVNRLSETKTEHVIDTPVGKVSLVTEKTPSSPHEIIKKWWAENKEDIKVFTYIAENSDWGWNEEYFQKTKKEWGDLGAPTIFIPRVNVQNLYIDLMGVEKAVYALMDYEAEIERYFKALDENHSRMIDRINKSPINIINFGDNLHCGTLPPYYFEKYVQPSYIERCKQLHEGGNFVYSHWDGDTKALLPFAKTCGLDGIEAITPKPQGDVTLEEVKEALGDDIYLVDGIAAVLFDEIYHEEELIQQTEELIRLFKDKLILGISDEISSTGDIERVRTVGKIVDDYNASLNKNK
ncbi:hypothetical protein AN1V17_41040 [Vallitalea sediminicola]